MKGLFDGRLWRSALAISVVALTVEASLLAQNLPAPIAHGQSLTVANATIPTRVLVQSPAETATELQTICLFLSDKNNTLHGSLAEMNTRLNGLLDRIRQPALFGGQLGETLVVNPAKDTMGARKILIIGLGDSESFVPARMELVGAILYREASRLEVAHPFFAPTVLDGGVTKYSTEEVSEQVMLGFLRAAATERTIGEAGFRLGFQVQDLTYLAGPAHAAETKAGLARAVASTKKQ